MSDVLATKESGFEVLTWWAAVGCVACHWRREEQEEADKHYSVIEDITEERYLYCKVCTTVSNDLVCTET